MTKSYYNPIEVEIIVGMLIEFVKVKGPGKVSVGIISGYAAQTREIHFAISKKFGLLESDALETLGISTERDVLTLLVFKGLSIDCRSINGFQGQERDIIIFSLTRANKKSSIGFMSDERRLNVALTRAKSSLWLIGNDNTYSENATCMSIHLTIHVIF